MRDYATVGQRDDVVASALVQTQGHVGGMFVGRYKPANLYR